MNYDVPLLDVARHLVGRYGVNAAFLAGQCLEVSIKQGSEENIRLCLDLIRAIEAVSDVSTHRAN